MTDPTPLPAKPIVIQPTAAPALLEQGVRAAAIGAGGLALGQIIHSDAINGFVAPSVLPFVGVLAAAAFSYGWGVYVTLRNHHRAKVMEPFVPDDIAQVKKVTGPANQHRVAAGAAGAAALILSLSAPMIQAYEGTVTATYRDPVGILTSCTGHTGPELHMGQVFTPDQCGVTLTKDEQGVLTRIAACTKGVAPIETWAAMASFAFNAGSGTYCRKFAPLIDAERLSAACAKLSLYTYAGGRQLPGLVRRRAGERALCEMGL